MQEKTFEMLCFVVARPDESEPFLLSHPAVVVADPYPLAWMAERPRRWKANFWLWIDWRFFSGRCLKFQNIGFQNVTFCNSGDGRCWQFVNKCLQTHDISVRFFLQNTTNRIYASLKFILVFIVLFVQFAMVHTSKIHDVIDKLEYWDIWWT